MGVFWVMLNMLEVHRGMQRVLWHILLLIVFWFIYGVLQDILRVLWGILGVLLGIVRVHMGIFIFRNMGIFSNIPTK